MVRVCAAWYIHRQTGYDLNTQCSKIIALTAHFIKFVCVIVTLFLAVAADVDRTVFYDLTFLWFQIIVNIS
jgi:hypothetical protein